MFSCFIPTNEKWGQKQPDIVDTTLTKGQKILLPTCFHVSSDILVVPVTVIKRYNTTHKQPIK